MQNVDKNEDVSFVVRSYCKCDKEDTESYGVNGTGRYVTRLSYKQYVDYLPDLVHYKLGIDGSSQNAINSFIQKICHEREWFVEKGYDNDSFGSQGNKEKLQSAICRWFKDVYEKLSNIEQSGKSYFTYMFDGHNNKEIFTREFRLLRDLVGTYSDLWYQNASESGFAFFIQLWIALNGIDEMLDFIRQLDRSDEILKEAISELFRTMHEIVCDLNAYNKQFQLLNQDSVNFPIYEIQSKVNSEKYMSAYCAFLHKFFVLYYSGKDENEYIVQGFPMALVDLSQRKIEANFYFPALYQNKRTKKDNSCVRSMFAVHFPSSEYFSNVFSSIPLLLHEASHTHHYGETESRNRAVIYNINRFIAKKIANLLISFVSDGIIVGTSDLLVETMTECVIRAINKKQKEYFDEIGEFGEWGFSVLESHCKEFYNGVFGISVDDRQINYNQFVKLKSRIQNDVAHLADIFGFPGICKAFSNKDDAFPESMYYLLNVLYLEFYPDFYDFYKGKIYNQGFLNDLVNAMKSDSEDETKRIMLELSLYLFVKFVIQDDSVISGELLQSVEEKKRDYLYVSFTVVIITGMWVIFQKYEKKFNSAVAESQFYNKLLPKIYMDDISAFAARLTDAYKEFSERDDVSMHDRSLMQSMFYDYFELYVSTNNIVRYFSDDSIFQSGKMLNYAEEFVSCIHDECREYMKKEERNGLFKAIFAKTNRMRLIKLGFFEEKSTVLNDVFEKTFSNNKVGFVDGIMEDRTWLFQEVYADCGMCCAMKFSMFGYLRFAISIHNVANEFYKISDFLVDRMQAVIRIYFDETKREEWPEIYTGFLKRLFDTDMVGSICNMLSLISDIEEVQDVRQKVEQNKFVFDIQVSQNKCNLNEIVKQSPKKEDFYEWKDQIIRELIGIMETKYEMPTLSEREKDQIFAAKEYLIHIHDIIDLAIEGDIWTFLPEDKYDEYFQEVWRYMEQDRGIHAVQEETCVKEISRFFNIDCPENETDKFAWYYRVYSNKFVTECNFIFDYYCEYKNAYYNLIKEIESSLEKGEVTPIHQWFDIIDGYYLKEES